MLTVESICCIKGKKLDISRLEALSGLRFRVVSVPGQVSTEAVFTSSQAQKDNFTIMLNSLTAHYKHMQLCGVEAIDLTLYLAYTHQCNWYVELEELKQLDALGIGLSIICREETDVLEAPIG